MNNSTLSIDDEQNKLFTIVEIIIRLMLAMTGTVGNAFVIYAVAMTPKLRTVPNALVTALAILDLIVSAVLIPLMVVGTVENEWPFDVSFCRVHGFMLIFFHALSLNILGLIAINRFLNITKPLHIYRKFATPQLFVIQLIVAVLLAGLPVLSPFFGIGSKDFAGFNPVLGHCSFGYDVEGVWVYEVVLLSLGLLIGTVVIPFTYALIWKHVGASRSRVHAWSTSALPKSMTEQQSNNESGSPNQEVSVPAFAHAISIRRIQHKDNLRLTRNLFLLFITYTLSLIPYCVFVFFDKHYSFSIWLWRAADILLWSTSAVNPYVYALMTSSFREAFRRLVGLSFYSSPQRT
ncbi:rhodopsin, GQ-coupled-like [Strongylocentrotus purpuratus]|uniref:G-protein coupled receptors family 1 profile domain-containing protein n=1 Tax=Strongylocentrotus purpuratus TaxID=7668 RepID=A0A7M7RFN1_STRPU|nr:rhodopsin, GQ-coupled-like [Strongylocentrotus purpuratus]|eukprot:XP_790735.1 PREDICTED: rhodopsin, GQ-coupled-like [Strongylocentrotus purpuratus]